MAAPGWWEYRKESTGIPVEQMNALGALGWELVCCTELKLIFKRPLNSRK